MSEVFEVTGDMLDELDAIATMHTRVMLGAVRERFGDELATTLYPLMIAMILGGILKALPGAEDIPLTVAQLWSAMDVPFTLDRKGRVQ